MEKMTKKIPLIQVAYQTGHSRTEQIFSMKILDEKAVTVAGL